MAVDNGIKLAVEEINADGGVLGKQIDYIVYDEKGDATEAVNAYNKLVQSDKVVAVIGDVTSKPTLAVAQQAAKDKICLLYTSIKFVQRRPCSARNSESGMQQIGCDYNL